MKLTLKDQEFILDDNIPNVDERAPEFQLKNLDNENVKLSDLLGDVLLVSTFPDINTSVCSKQTAKFNELAATLEDTKILSISANTAEDQRDWCGAQEIHTTLLHDEDRSFGKDYGIYIDEIDKLARTIFVINREGKIVYREIVGTMTNEPNYEDAIAAARHEESEI